MIVEGFDNAWHVLRAWAAQGYQFFALERHGLVPAPRPLLRDEIESDNLIGLDYFPIPTLATVAGDNPDPERSLTPAEILIATAIAEGWEPSE